MSPTTTSKSTIAAPSISSSSSSPSSSSLSSASSFSPAPSTSPSSPSSTPTFAASSRRDGELLSARPGDPARRPSPPTHESCAFFHPLKCTLTKRSAPSPRSLTTLASYQLPYRSRAWSVSPTPTVRIEISAPTVSTCSSATLSVTSSIASSPSPSPPAALEASSRIDRERLRSRPGDKTRRPSPLTHSSRDLDHPL